MQVMSFPLWIPITREQFIECHKRYTRECMDYKNKLEVRIVRTKDRPEEVFYVDPINYKSHLTSPIFRVICEYKFVRDDGRFFKYFIRQDVPIIIPSAESVQGKFKLEYMENGERDNVRTGSKPVCKTGDRNPR